MKRLLKMGAFIAVVTAMGTGEAYAQQFRTYMLVPGIAGSSVDVGREGWIDVLSLSQGVSSARRSVACSDVSILKVLDQAGPALWAAAAARQTFSEIRIEVARGAETPAVVYDIRLSNARVTSSQTSGSGDQPVEGVSFSYDAVTLTFNTQAPGGGTIPGTPQVITCQ